MTKRDYPEQFVVARGLDVLITTLIDFMNTHQCDTGILPAIQEDVRAIADRHSPHKKPAGEQPPDES